VCVGRVVLGARRDPRSCVDSVFQMIQDWEAEHPFGGKGGMCQSGIKESSELTFVRRGIRSINTMSPRRRVDPPIVNRAIEREMRELCVRLDAMETTKRRAPNARDIS
jgi:hypothetical protein